MKFFKSHFRYNKRQRNGIFFLLCLIIGLQFGIYNIDFPITNNSNFTTEQIQKFQLELDMLELETKDNLSLKKYPFNPNFISDFKGYQLGLSLDEIDKLHKFRSKNLYVNSSKEFQKITGVSDSLLLEIAPLFKFPEWVKPEKRSSMVADLKESKNLIKKDINLATEDDFQLIHGIGDKLSIRIIKYRNLLGGFSLNEQLDEVWGLDLNVKQRIWDSFEVKILPNIVKINVNEASFKELLAVAYIDYDLTKKIINYRDEVAEIQSLDELKKIDGFPVDKFDRIALYLVAE